MNNDLSQEDLECTKIECPKNCRECPYKTFDSDSSQEFICDLYGWIV